MTTPTPYRGIFYYLGVLKFFCRHREQRFWRNIYGDEIIMRGWKRSVWECHRCGKIVLKDQLHEETLA